MADPNPFDQFDATPSATPTAGPITVGIPRPKEPSIPSGFEPDPKAPGSLRPIPGGPADKKTTGDALTPEALDAETTNWILTGKMSPLGMGNGPLRVQIENNRPVIMKKYGISDNSLPAVQKQFDADSKAYSARTQQISLMNQANDAAKQHIEQISGYLNNLPAQTNLTPLNYLSLEAQRAVSGRTVTDLDATIPLLQGEVAKIMTANPSSGAGQLTDDARREFDIINSSRSPDARKEAMQALMEMVNRKITGTQSEADRLNQRINGGLASYAVTPGGPSGGTPPAGGPINPLAGGGGGDQGPTLTPSSGETRSVIDPQKQALGAKIVGLMSKGADRNTILGYAVRADPTLRTDPQFRAWVDQGISYRKKYPGAKFPIDPGFYTSEVALNRDEQDRNAGAQSALGAAAMNAGNTATGGAVADLDPRVAQAISVAQAQHPNASLAGMVGGGALAGMGLEAGLGKLGVEGIAKPILADAIYGGGANAANPNGSTLGNIAKGAAIGVGGGLLGKGVTKGLGAAAEGVTSPSVSYVNREVPGALTIGQAVGQSGRVGAAVKGIEDRLSGLPVVGDTINARRLEGLQKMNSKAFDKALEPIKATASGQFGEQAVADAQDKVSGAFQQALGGKVVSLDNTFIADGAKAKMALDKLPDSAAADVEKLVDGVMNDHFSDTHQLTGENLQSALRELAGIKASYKATPAGHRIGKVIDDFSASLEGLFQRQAPEVMPQYQSAKKAAQRLYTLEDAVLKAKNTGGVFTPAQLGMADRSNTIAFGGKGKAAAGGGEFHDFQRAMQDILPNKVPDSGTAGRLLLPAAVLGAGGAGGYETGNTEKGLTLGAMLSLAYSKAGQRALTAAVLKRGAAANAAGQALKRAAPVIGHGTAASAALGTSRD